MYLIFARDSISGKAFQPSIYDLWSIQPVSFLLAGCLFIQTVALEGGMCSYQTAEFFFHSLAAIYDLFTPYQVGCKVSQLYKVGVRQGIPYEGRKCRVSREPIRRKKSRRKA